jgi:hypothetical protein
VNGEAEVQHCDRTRYEVKAVDKMCCILVARASSRYRKDQREVPMAKIDLDSLSIEELAGLRENAADKLFEKVATRRAELEAELEKLVQYGKPVKKAESAPAPKAKKTEEVKEPKEKEPKEQVAKAA